MSGRLVVDHVIPVYEDVHLSCVSSLLAMATRGALEGAIAAELRRRGGADQYDEVLVRHGFGRGQPVSLCRNEIVRQVLLHQRADPEYTDTEYVILWQDSDVAVSVDDAAELVATLALAAEDVGVLGAVVPIQEERSTELRPNVSLSAPALPRGLRSVATSRATVERELGAGGGSDRPYQVARMGLAFVAVRAAVYENLPRPWHRFEHLPPPAVGGEEDLSRPDDVLGEDLGWCDEVRRMGWQVWALPSVCASHVVRRRLRWPAFEQVTQSDQVTSSQAGSSDAKEIPA